MTEPDPPGPLARRDGEPAFDEPWQAQVMALAASLVEGGAFDAPAWSRALGAALERAAARGAPDEPATYYRAALEALEGLLDETGGIGAEALAERTEAWRRAYLATPHGRPVTLAAASPGEVDRPG